MQLVLQQRLYARFLHFSFAGDGLLPAIASLVTRQKCLLTIVGLIALGVNL
jgi:hypothetical protein